MVWHNFRVNSLLPLIEERHEVLSRALRGVDHCPVPATWRPPSARHRASTEEDSFPPDCDIPRSLDLALLDPNMGVGGVMKGVGAALEAGLRSVTVLPARAALVSAWLSGSGVKLCGVVGYPLGSTTMHAKSLECQEMLGLGVDELDIVMNVGEMRSLSPRHCVSTLKALVDGCHSQGARVRVILQTPSLSTPLSITDACLYALAAGADGVVPSTGVEHLSGWKAAPLTPAVLADHMRLLTLICRGCVWEGETEGDGDGRIKTYCAGEDEAVSCVSMHGVYASVAPDTMPMVLRHRERQVQARVALAVAEQRWLQAERERLAKKGPAVKAPLMSPYIRKALPERRPYIQSPVSLRKSRQSLRKSRRVSETSSPVSERLASMRTPVAAAVASPLATTTRSVTSPPLVPTRSLVTSGEEETAQSGIFGWRESLVASPEDVEVDVDTVEAPFTPKRERERVARESHSTQTPSPSLPTPLSLGVPSFRRYSVPPSPLTDSRVMVAPEEGERERVVVAPEGERERERVLISSRGDLEVEYEAETERELLPL
ncbi:deoxyribose-phosphate aldolase [Kipferlia bialata]|uniref:Deoxyribose-phosphate aldolase n=1 Tax=Kipferlia bialata TaxID=797122 RepID=A0A9K3CY82_9EUKA|nr:deoxyribose-phosphate aldolase [Kipferlia bialata]|eukprot:g7107.t1